LSYTPAKGNQTIKKNPRAVKFRFGLKLCRDPPPAFSGREFRKMVQVIFPLAIFADRV